MDILSDVNVVGSIKVTGGANLDGGSIIGGSLAIFPFGGYGTGSTIFSTARADSGFVTIDNGTFPIVILRNSGGSSTLNLARSGKVVVCGTLQTNSFSYFCKDVHNYSDVYFNEGIHVECMMHVSYLKNYHGGKIHNSFFNNNHVFGETTTIDVPADCTRFFIGDVYVIHDDANFDFRTVECLADYFVYPTISVYKDNKKVDMDIEVDTLGFPSGNEGEYANNSFTEVIIGNIKACSSDQQFKVAISPTFQFDY